MTKTKWSFIILLIASVIPYAAISQVMVSDDAELQDAIEAIVPGSEIILGNGVWTDIELFVYAEGTSDEPIVIRAETIGEVFFEGNSIVKIGGSYITIEGIVFQNPSDINTDEPVIEFESSNGLLCHNCTLTNVKIDSYNGSEDQASNTFKWILLKGQNNEISYCSFIGKFGVGSIINDNRNQSAPDYSRIHHNYFADRTPIREYNQDNDQDAIRIGNSSTSLLESYTQVYDNFFYNFSGEIEVISNKSCNNKYYRNTFRDYQGSLTLRHGNDCEVYNNFFFANENPSSGGIRVMGERHLVYNNYIADTRLSGGGLGGINITNGRENSALNGYYRVIGGQIVHNTFVNCDAGLSIGTNVAGDLDEFPLDIEVSNNIFFSSNTEELYRAIGVLNAPVGNSVIAGNISQNGVWEIETGVDGNIEVESGLLVEGDPFYRLAEGSAAINAGTDDYSFVTTDMLGGVRSGTLDAGAEEFGSDGILMPYTVDDVGITVGFNATTVVEDELELELSARLLEAYGDGADLELHVVSNVDWTITSSEDWLVLDTLKGKNSYELTATMQENTSGEERTATVTVSQDGGDMSEDIVFWQSGLNSDVSGLTKISPVDFRSLGTSGDNRPENALDGNESTEWVGSPAGISFISFDLGNTYQLTALRINFDEGDEKTYDFQLFTSQDDDDFVESTEILTSTGLTDGFEKFDLGDDFPVARYIRIVGQGSSEDGQSRYEELEMYGDLVLSTDINSLSASGVVAYPNPANNGILNINSSSLSLDRIQLIDIEGRLLIDEYALGKEASLDISNLKAGVYILSLPNIGRKRIVIQ